MKRPLSAIGVGTLEAHREFLESKPVERKAGEGASGGMMESVFLKELRRELLALLKQSRISIGGLRGGSTVDEGDRGPNDPMGPSWWTRELMEAFPRYKSALIELNMESHTDDVEMLWEQLRNNPMVTWNGKWFRFRPRVDVDNREELIEYIQRHPEGTLLQDLEFTYPSVADDVVALQTQGLLYVIENKQAKTHVVFLNDPTLLVDVSPQVRQLFLDAKPDDSYQRDREARKTLDNTARSLSRQETTRRRRQHQRFFKVANQHMPKLEEKIRRLFSGTRETDAEME